jgi:hypothetical protein
LGVVRGLVVAAGVWALVAAGPARAAEPADSQWQRPAFSERREVLTQSTFRFTGRFRNFSPGQPAPGGPGNTSVPVLPFGFQETYPLTPFQHPLILRDYLQMRATSPRPNEYLGGQFNPQYVGVVPHGRFNHGSHYYGGGYVEPYPGGYGYGGYSYGGYATGAVAGLSTYPSIYSGYGSWYPQSLAQDRVIVQREIIYVKPQGEGERPSQESTADYYLTRPRTTESLRDATDDIRRAWLNGDFARLQSRLRDGDRVRIYLKGKYQYSVGGTDFAQMTRDAMTRIDTTAFELDRVTDLGEGRAFAAGKHTYVDPDKAKREVYVSYGLVKDGGRWKLAEAGSGSSPISAHTE